METVVNEVRHGEEAVARVVSLAKQGQWMRWEGLEKRKLSWRQLWEIDPNCALCPIPATLKQILTGNRLRAINLKALAFIQQGQKKSSYSHSIPDAGHLAMLVDIWANN